METYTDATTNINDITTVRGSSGERRVNAESVKEALKQGCAINLVYLGRRIEDRCQVKGLGNQTTTHGGKATMSEAEWKRRRTSRHCGDARELPAEIVEALDAIWRETITPALGFADYAALAAALRERNS